MRAAPERVPWRTIAASIGLVLVTLAALVVVREVARILAWIVVAGFVAVVVNPVVTGLERRVGMKRGVATILVFVSGFVLVAALGYTFVRPLVDQAYEFADKFPQYVDDAKAGRGPAGRLVQRYDVDTWIEENQDRLRESVRNVGTPALGIVRTVANTVVALVTILVLAVLMVLEGPKTIASALNVFDERRRERISRVMADCSRAVTGYMAGNLVISLIAGVATFIFLSIVRVPFSGVLSLWVAFADLIPLVGATLGAVPAVLVAFLHSVQAGVLTLGFFIAYQQFENHVLQVTVMSRTVDLNPLAVLISVLVGVELSGILGALLAIPVAGVLQVIVRDVYDERTGRFKEVPTVGADEQPIDDVVDEEADEPPAPATTKRAGSKTSATKAGKAAAKKTAAKKAAEKAGRR